MKTPTPTPKPIAPAAASTQASASTPDTLTIVVTDAKSQRAVGARVTMEPSGATGLTDSNGEIQFKLGNAPKYNVTVILGSNKVVVPYYVTKGGAARLMVNPTYVKTVEAAVARGQAGWIGSHLGTTFGTGFAILIAVAVVWLFIKRRRYH